MCLFQKQQRGRCDYDEVIIYIAPTFVIRGTAKRWIPYDIRLGRITK